MTTTKLFFAGLLVSGCATVGSAGGKGASAPFPGQETLVKRRNEILDASKVAQDCMKVKQGEAEGKGGIFAVMADEKGKVTAQVINWDGPAPMSQCIVDAAQKTTLTPSPGPAVG